MDTKRNSEDRESGEGAPDPSFEHSRLIDDDDVRPSKRRSARYGRTVFILSLSNAICTMLLLMAAIVLHTGPTKCLDPNTVHYPKKPKWFPPESKLPPSP